MTKHDIATLVAVQANMTYVESLELVDFVFDIMKESLLNNDYVAIRGLGTLKVITRKQKKGRDIWKKRNIVIPEHQTIKFTPSVQLKNKLNGR